MFSWDFCKILKNIFLIEQLRWLLLPLPKYISKDMWNKIILNDNHLKTERNTSFVKKLVRVMLKGFRLQRYYFWRDF